MQIRADDLSDLEKLEELLKEEDGLLANINAALSAQGLKQATKVSSLASTGKGNVESDGDEEESSAPGVRSPVWSITLAVLSAAGLLLW